MLQTESVVKITDNAGGQIGKIFKVLGGSKRRYMNDFIKEVHHTSTAKRYRYPNFISLTDFKTCN